MATTRQLLRIVRVTDPGATDGDLLSRYLHRREEDAFAELVRRNGPLVFRACRSVLGEATAAEDAFQATFLVLARNAARLTRPGSLAGWLYGTAVRIARDARRADARARRREFARVAPGPASPDDLTWRQVREVLDVELANLPERYRLPLVLCYVLELSYEEAARRAACSVGALRGRLERGKERLRKRLARYGLPLAAPALVFGPPTPVSAAVERATLESVRTMAAGGRVAAAAATLAGLRTSPRATVLVPAAVIAVAVGAVLAGAGPGGAPPPDPPPRPALGGVPAVLPPRADLHGDSLPAGAVMRLGTTRFRHGEWATAVAFSPDGTEVASAAADHTVRIWDRHTGRELRRLKGPFAFPHTVAYADGGRRVVTAEGWFPDPGWGATPVRLWDARTGDLVRVVAERGPRLDEALAVAADGKTVAFRVGDAVVLHPVAEGGRSGELPVRHRAVPTLAFSPDGTRLLVGLGACAGSGPAADPYGVRLFDLTRPPEASRKPEPLWTREEKVDHVGWWRDPAAVFSPDGKHVLVSFGARQQPVLVDAATGTDVRRFAGPRVAAYPFLFLPGGARILTPTDGGPGAVWDVGTGKPVADLPWEEPDVRGGAALSPDGKTVITVGHRAIRLWDAAGKEHALPPASVGEIDRLAVFPDGRRVLAVSTNDQASGARLWDLHTGRLLAAVPGGASAATPAPDGKTFAVVSASGGPDVFEATTGRVIRRGGANDSNVGVLVYGLGGKVLVGCGDGRGIHVWDAGTLKPLPPLLDKFPAGRGARTMAVTPDGARLVVPEYDGVVRVWDLASGKVLREWTTGGRGAWQVALSANGRFAATAVARGAPDFSAREAVIPTAVNVWDLETGRAVAEFDGPDTGVTCLAFAPDSRAITVGTHRDGTRVYELASGKCRSEYRGHQGEVTAVAFAPDGRRLMSGGSDTQVLAWDLLGPVPGAAAPGDVGRAWAGLLAPDAAGADRAMRYLASAPEDAIAEFRKRLRAEPETDPKRVRELIERLGAPRFADREKAEAELERLGAAVVPALKEALHASDSEVVSRARTVSHRLDRLALTGERLRAVRAVEVLERIGSPDARTLLAALAQGDRGARVTQEASAAVERLKGRK